MRVADSLPGREGALGCSDGLRNVHRRHKGSSFRSLHIRAGVRPSSAPSTNAGLGNSVPGGVVLLEDLEAALADAEVSLEVGAEEVPRDKTAAAGVAEDAPAHSAVVAPVENVEPRLALVALLAGVVGHPVALQVILHILHGYHDKYYIEV